ncbi:MAG: DnaJ domain-containing protein [Nitrosopumilaceae archaeon]|nr:DnaJ domain-containing protein [Nitrosopumilaceae archaeon]
MKKYFFIFLTILIAASFTPISGQVEDSSSNLEYNLSLEEKIILFGGFAVAVIAVFLYIARDVIFRKKTTYDKEEFESKKDRTYEKYHSDWTDDYVDFTYTRPSEDEAEFRKQARESTLPDYYKILGVKRTANQDEIKHRYRELVKKLHPDKTKEERDEEMIEIIKAYRILSNQERREKYDKHLGDD